jgi:hypothetical protein
MAATVPATSSAASSLRKMSGTPFWNISPVRSALAMLSCLLLGRNHSKASRVQRSMATRIYPLAWP